MENINLFLVSSYELGTYTNTAEDEETIRARIQSITKVKEEAEEGGTLLELLICADWNRHHVLWGGLEARN